MKTSRFGRELAAAVFIPLFMAGCAVLAPAARQAKPLPARHAYAPQDTLRMSDAAKFFYKFAFPDSTQQTLNSKGWVVCEYLSKHLFWVKSGAIMAGDSSLIYPEGNFATAFHIGGRYFLTAAHVVGNVPDSTWTVNRTVDAGSNYSGLPADLPANNRVLVAPEDGPCYSYMVIFRDDTLDVAVLEADSSFFSPACPAIVLDSRSLKPGDKIAHFMNGVKTQGWKTGMSSLDRREVSVLRNSGAPMLWSECALVFATKPPFRQFLLSQGYVFDFTPEQLEMRTLYPISLAPGSRFRENFNISTVLAAHGNSGSPIFRKDGERYSLVGMVQYIVLGRQTYTLIGNEWQLSALCFAKPERLQGFFSRLIDANSGK